ncbi:MAG: glutamate--tRNA ligase [Candidatus Babeliales bacterium]
MTVRLRFAPAPSGFMHPGNIFTAVNNYLFARKYGGTLVLRIEDTDPTRNVDPQASSIISDLQWLHIHYDEGPLKGGSYGPYFQSQRSDIYKKMLHVLETKNKVYRCFCSAELLQEKRARQIALKLPPRYDRTCYNLSAQESASYLQQNKPYTWRFKLDHTKQYSITDIAQKTITFDLQHFSDFPLTRSNGTYTFMFANCIDDIMMNITHVFRGQDHLSNTAGQIALIHALDAPQPMYWHMPVLCGANGKKLSKRDFGFSLKDLQKSGYLSEALCNYLAIIGKETPKQEIASLKELIETINFNTLPSSSHIHYDVEKLTWTNHQWIQRLPLSQLVVYATPFITPKHKDFCTLSSKSAETLIDKIRPECKTLADIPDALDFYFSDTPPSRTMITELIPLPVLTALQKIVKQHSSLITKPDEFLSTLKAEATTASLPVKYLFLYLRLALSHKTKGPSLHDLFALLPEATLKKRLNFMNALFEEPE